MLLFSRVAPGKSCASAWAALAWFGPYSITVVSWSWVAALAAPATVNLASLSLAEAEVVRPGVVVPL